MRRKLAALDRILRLTPSIHQLGYEITKELRKP
jgi:hypothetical protein